MKYLLDTDVVVNHLRGKESLTEAMLNDEPAMSIITLGELLYGVYKSDNPHKSLAKLEEDLNLLNLKVENLNEATVSEFAKIKAHLEILGEKLDDFDLLIGAVAIVNNLILVTRNLRHFKRIKGLKIYKEWGS